MSDNPNSNPIPNPNSGEVSNPLGLPDSNRATRPVVLQAHPSNRDKRVSGHTVIASHTSLREDGTVAQVVILGFRTNNVYSDDFEYVVATMENWDSTSWFSNGQYRRTLGMALSTFHEESERAARMQFPVVRRLS
jgi:hypothetical protein